MRLALAFRRPDVDAFLDEIDHEQFSEWCAFLLLEPQGWQATKIAAARQAFITAQAGSRKKLRERDFEIRLAAEGVQGSQAEKARWEAMSVRTEIAAGR